MWDYDKLFAKGNIIGIKKPDGEIYHIDAGAKQRNVGVLSKCYNDSLSFDTNNGESFIQYIIRLDGHGNVVEQLFDREKDMLKPMPELKTGMFVRLADKTNWKDNTVAYVDHQNNRLIAKEGWFEALSRKDEWRYLRIVEVFSKNVCCFNLCVDNSVIWRSPEYQAYLDSKSN